MNFRHILSAAALVVGSATAAVAQTAAPAPTPQAVDSLSRAVASYVGPSVAATIQSLATLDSNIDIDTFLAAFADIVRGGEAPMTLPEADAYIDSYVRGRRPSIPDTLSLESQTTFIAEAAALPGAVLLPSGTVLITEKAGNGPCPADTSLVSITYEGRFSNGFVFDSTDTPVEMMPGQLVTGFSEGLRHMQPGGRYRLVMPASAAYGPMGIRGSIPGNAALDFSVDLIAIKPDPDAAPQQ